MKKGLITEREGGGGIKQRLKQREIESKPIKEQERESVCVRAIRQRQEGNNKENDRYRQNMERKKKERQIKQNILMQNKCFLQAH